MERKIDLYLNVLLEKSSAWLACTTEIKQALEKAEVHAFSDAVSRRDSVIKGYLDALRRIESLLVDCGENCPQGQSLEHIRMKASEGASGYNRSWAGTLAHIRDELQQVEALDLQIQSLVTEVSCRLKGSLMDAGKKKQMLKAYHKSSYGGMSAYSRFERKK